ncbi:hypothetical protein HWV62_39387 [Athelia sp. TMB]|nr:hypothetical protein HWV62_39387 [Athelia sp. TMB]
MFAPDRMLRQNDNASQLTPLLVFVKAVMYRLPMERVKSMNHQELKLALALHDATEDPSQREAPWYAVWSLHFGKYLSQVCEDAQTISVPIWYPQYSLVAYCDKPESDEAQDASDCEDDDQSDDEQDRPSSPDQLDILESWKTRAPAPSIPISASTLSAPQGEIPCDSQLHPRGLNTKQRSAFIAAEKIRSTRIPDFLRMLHCMREDAVKVIDSRVDLLVEIKPAGFLRTKWHVVIGQLHQQARRAFHNDPHLQVLGALAASGPEWFYLEIRRGDVAPLKANSDSSYQPSDADVNDSSILSSHPGDTTIAAALTAFFANNEILVLDTQKSDRASKLLAARLKELNPGLWPSEGDED